MRSHKLILAWNAHLVHRKFGFRRYRAGMILLTASFIRLSPLRNGEQGVKIPLFLHQLVEAAGFGDTAVFQDEDAVIAAQERGLQRVRHDDAGHTGQVEEVGRTRFPIPPARPAAAFPAATSDHFLANFSPVYHKIPRRARRNRTTKTGQ